jgi:transcription-repair coupling factor (superfamily II helicase)
MQFPEKVYTEVEHRRAKKLIDKGYKHELTVEGEADFRRKVDLIIDLIKTAGYYDFFRTYIRQIKEVDGLTQLRETEVAIWANKFAVENVVDAASLFIQKAYHMNQYIDGEIYYGGTSEKFTVGV